MTDDALVESLQAHYGAAARKEGEAVATGPIADGAAARRPRRVLRPGGRGLDRRSAAGLYDTAELAELPAEAVAGSIGCANPVALAQLAEGEDVLDLGSGGGIDVLLSARRVGPSGQGLRPGHDRRDARARPGQPGEGRRDQRRVPRRPHRGGPAARSQRRRRGVELRHQPVRRQGRRVRRGPPGASPRRAVAVADVVADMDPDTETLADDAAWAACIAGAVTRDRYRAQLG